jgi:hypothetical protein
MGSTADPEDGHAVRPSSPCSRTDVAAKPFLYRMHLRQRNGLPLVQLVDGRVAAAGLTLSDRPRQVAVTCYSAAVIYAAFIAFCGCQVRPDPFAAVAPPTSIARTNDTSATQAR